MLKFLSIVMLVYELYTYVSLYFKKYN